MGVSKNPKISLTSHKFGPKAVSDDAGAESGVVRSVEELKKKMKVVMLSALVRSKSETEEAGHDLFCRVSAASEDESASESDAEHHATAVAESSKENQEEGAVKKVLEEFIEGSKQSRELLDKGEGNARGNLLVELLGSLKNELHKEVRQARKKRRKKMAAAASAASTSIVLTEEETKVRPFS